MESWEKGKKQAKTGEGAIGQERQEVLMPGTYARAKGVCLKMWGGKGKAGQKPWSEPGCQWKAFKMYCRGFCCLFMVFKKNNFVNNESCNC